MQLYGACSPLVRRLLQLLAPPQQTAVTREQRIDSSGVDGISLWLSQLPSPRDDVSAFCQPSSETVDAVRQVCASAGPRLVLLVNPQWRETRDAYDTLGGRGGLLGRVGNFLGGTSGAQADMAALGFQDAYLVQQYVVRGDDCQIVLAYPYPSWVVYTTVRPRRPRASRWLLPLTEAAPLTASRRRRRTTAAACTWASRRAGPRTRCSPPLRVRAARRASEPASLCGFPVRREPASSLTALTAARFPRTSRRCWRPGASPPSGPATPASQRCAVTLGRLAPRRRRG